MAWVVGIIGCNGVSSYICLLAWSQATSLHLIKHAHNQACARARIITSPATYQAHYAPCGAYSHLTTHLLGNLPSHCLQAEVVDIWKTKEKKYSDEELDFMQRVYVKSGLGQEETYLPPAIHPKFCQGDYKTGVLRPSVVSTGTVSALPSLPVLAIMV